MTGTAEDKREHSRGHGLPLTRGELLLVILGGVIIGLNLIGLPLLAGLT